MVNDLIEGLSGDIRVHFFFTFPRTPYKPVETLPSHSRTDLENSIRLRVFCDNLLARLLSTREFLVAS